MLIGTVEPPFCENNSVTSFDEVGLYMDYTGTVTLKEVLIISEEAFGPNSLKLSIGDENIGSLQKASRPGFFVVVFFRNVVNSNEVLIVY